jgi:hypothetical protein
MCFLAEAVCSKLLTLGHRLKPSTAKWAADRFKKGHQASNPASTRALLQHRALRFLETALLILYGSNCLRLRAWWQSPLSSSSNASAPDLRLIAENHVASVQ